MAPKQGPFSYIPTTSAVFRPLQFRGGLFCCKPLVRARERGIDQRPHLLAHRIGVGGQELGHEDGGDVVDGIDPERGQAAPPQKYSPSLPMVMARALSITQAKPSPKPTPSLPLSLNSERDISIISRLPGRWFRVISSSVFGERK